MGEQRATNLQTIAGLCGWVLFCFGAALGAVYVPGEWYATLTKPPFNPPAWVFGPVWSVLYTLMGVAAWRVWQRGGFAAQRRPLFVFILQLVLNAIWTPLFFGLHWLGVAFMEICMLWLAIAWTIAEFRRVDRLAAVLLWPYLAWVSFASVLNGTLWRLNA